MQGDGSLEFFIDRDRARDELRVYLIQRRSNGRFWCGTVNGDTGGVVMEEANAIEEGGRLKPLLVMSARYSNDFLKAMAAMLEGEGVLTQKAARLEALCDEKDRRIVDLQGVIHLLSKTPVGEDWRGIGPKAEYKPIYKTSWEQTLAGGPGYADGRVDPAWANAPATTAAETPWAEQPDIRNRYGLDEPLDQVVGGGR